MKKFSQTPIAFPVCRVCLAFDMKMYSLGPQTTRIFEEITKTKIHPEDGKPQAVCYICFSLLKRCLLFANMSQLAEGILMQILRTNPVLTRQLVTQHTECIVSFFYSTPIVVNSLPDEISCYDNVSTTSIVKGSITTTYTYKKPVTTEHVTTEPVKHVTTEPLLKTAYLNEDEIILETPDLIIKKVPEYNMGNESNILISSVTKEIVTTDLVTVKTEIMDEDEIVETSDVNIKQEQDSTSDNESDNDIMKLITNVTYEEIKNEQLMLVDNQTEEREVDLELIVSQIAQNIENERAVFGNDSDNEPNERNKVSTHQIQDCTDQIQLNEKIKISKDKDKPPNDIKQDIASTDHNTPQTIQFNHKNTAVNKDTTDKQKDMKTSEDTEQSNVNIKTNQDKRKLDNLISELKQEINDEINAMTNEELEQSETSSDCIVVSDEEMSGSDDVTIIIEDNETQKPSNRTKHKKTKLL